VPGQSLCRTSTAPWPRVPRACTAQSRWLPRRFRCDSRRMQINWGDIARLGRLGVGLVGRKKAHSHGVPYSLTSEFTAVHRLHPMLPDAVPVEGMAEAVPIGTVLGAAGAAALVPRPAHACTPRLNARRAARSVRECVRSRTCPHWIRWRHRVLSAMRPMALHGNCAPLSCACRQPRAQAPRRRQVPAGARALPVRRARAAQLPRGPAEPSDDWRRRVAAHERARHRHGGARYLSRSRTGHSEVQRLSAQHQHEPGYELGAPDGRRRGAGRRAGARARARYAADPLFIRRRLVAPRQLQPAQRSCRLLSLQ
jgi:hypothetical protein